MEGNLNRFIVDETLALFERDREEINQSLGGIGEPEEVAELELLSKSALVPDFEPGLEAELAVEPKFKSEREPEPEPHEVAADDWPISEPVPEPEIVTDMEPEPILESEIKPKAESRSWEDRPALQPVQRPDLEVPVATQSLEDCFLGPRLDALQ